MGEKVNQKNSWSSTASKQDSAFKLRRFTINDNNDEEIQKSPESLRTDINPSKFSLPKNPPFPNANVQCQEENQEEKEAEEKPEINLKSDALPIEEPEEENNSEQDSPVNLKPDLLSTKTSEDEKENSESNSIQTKLTIGKPGDKYEQEADTTAAKVMAMSNKESEEIHRQSYTNVATKPKVLKYSSLSLQAKANKISTSLSLESRLGSSKGGGSTLPDDVRGFMEPRFGADFGDVRVHTDSSAVQMNKELGAQAFAHGNDIYYGAGKSPGNNELTAHELTHTIQQTGGLKLNKQINRQEKEEEETQTVQAKELPTSVIQSTFNKEIQLQAKEEESEEIQPKLITNYPLKASKDIVQSQPLTASSVSPRIQGNWFPNIEGKIAQFANDVPGFSLLTLILGKNPITDKPVKRNPTNLIGGVLNLVPGGDRTFADLQKSGALNKAFAWFKQQIAIMNITWTSIKSLFRRAWKSLGATDILNPFGAWERIKKIFLSPIKRIKNFAFNVGKKVMEFVFEGVMNKLGGGGAKVMGIIQSAGKHFSNIIQNPIGFAGNLVTAVRGGFRKFRTNMPNHLKNGLTGWLFGALGRAGLSVPAKFDLKGIVSIVLQVLKLTKHKLRTMLADKIGEPRVARLEKTFDFLRTIVTGGLGAAWQKIAEFTGNLKETVIGGIRQWVQNSVIKAAIVKLISMFNPAGAVVQAVMAIYNTIQFFIERGSQIAALAQSVFASIGKIAAGNVGGAANYVEQTMGRTLPVTISFLARLINLGGIGGQIRNIIERIQAPIHQALDRLVSFIVSKARGLVKGKKGKDKDDKSTDKDRKAGLAAFEKEEKPFLKHNKISKNNAYKVAKGVKQKHPVFKSINVIDGKDSWNYKYVFRISEPVDTPSEKQESTTITRKQRRDLQGKRNSLGKLNQAIEKLWKRRTVKEALNNHENSDLKQKLEASKEKLNNTLDKNKDVQKAYEIFYKGQEGKPTYTVDKLIKYYEEIHEESKELQQSLEDLNQSPKELEEQAKQIRQEISHVYNSASKINISELQALINQPEYAGLKESFTKNLAQLKELIIEDEATPKSIDVLRTVKRLADKLRGETQRIKTLDDISATAKPFIDKIGSIILNTTAAGRENPDTGDGSTEAAAIAEAKSGEPTKDKWHGPKCAEEAKGLQKAIESLRLLLQQDSSEEVKTSIKDAINRGEERRKGLLTGENAWRDSPHYSKAPIKI